MEQENAVKRRFSLEDDFMNYKVDDILFGFMRSLSTAYPIYENGKIIKWEEYLTKKELAKNKRAIAQICGYSTSTLNRHIQELEKRGLVETQSAKRVVVLDKVGNELEYFYDCYLFPYEKDGKYKIIEKDMLKYLVNTRSANAIKIYLYLLNKYGYVQNYEFTIKELQINLGYAETTIVDDMINDILLSLSREGLIKYTKEMVYLEDAKHMIPKFVLKYVAKSVKELR